MQQHRAHARFLNEFQSFYVHDAARAAGNYDLVYQGDGRRLDRAVYRFEVRPRVSDRASWVLELDTVTGYPLYRGERLPTGKLISEVVVTSFATGSAAAIPADVTWWAPLIPLLDFQTPAQGISILNDPRLFVPQRPVLPSGYVLHQTRATMMPFNREVSFVLVYSDGIDTLVVTEKPIPGAQAGNPAEQNHRALLYSDQGMTQARFYHNTVEYLVVGRGVRDVVRRFAESVYREASSR
jgi:negative regulator of sigma E activity